MLAAVTSLTEPSNDLIRGEGLVTFAGRHSHDRAGQSATAFRFVFAISANVSFAPMLRQGAVTRDGDREAVIGMVMMLMGGNSRQVVADVKHKIAEIQKTLPEGVDIDTFYDRTELVEKTIHTVAENIGLGVVLVIIMLFCCWATSAPGLIVAAAIPLSAMVRLIAMRYAGVSANLMSLGAVDFGVIVDGAVVMIENCVRRATQYQRDHGGKRVPNGVFRESAKEVGQADIVCGHHRDHRLHSHPEPARHGREDVPADGVHLHDGASSALILSVTVMPVMASLFLARKIQERETFLVRWIKRAYRAACLHLRCHDPSLMFVAFGRWLFAVSVFMASGFGVEFVPKLDEGDIAIQATRLPSVSLETSIEMTKAMERCLLEVPASRNGYIEDWSTRDRQRSDGRLSDGHFCALKPKSRVARADDQSRN